MAPSKEGSNGNKRRDLALVLSGGGARAAYQVGALRGIARHFPGLRFRIMVGVSAGAINTGFFAAHPGGLLEAAEELAGIWSRLRVEDVFRLDVPALARGLLRWLRWSLRQASPDAPPEIDLKGLVSTEPLRVTIRRASAVVDGELIGIARNLEMGRLKAVAMIGLSYSTGQTVIWVQGRDVELWQEPRRRSVHARLTVEHVMASSALPLIFPAVRLGPAWYGDGGIRLSAPLAPAIRLGAERVLAISARYEPTFEEADQPQIVGYPPPAQVLSHLLHTLFLDVLDEDVRRLEKLNLLLEKLPPEEREGMRPVAIRVIRPSADLGKLAAEYEPQLPDAFRLVTRSLGTRKTTSPDFLTYLMFQPDYMERLIRLGEADVEAHLPELRTLLEG